MANESCIPGRPQEASQKLANSKGKYLMLSLYDNLKWSQFGPAGRAMLRHRNDVAGAVIAGEQLFCDDFGFSLALL